MDENLIHIKSGMTENVDASEKNFIYVKKIIFGMLLRSCENGKYLASITDNSVITYDEIIHANVTKTILRNIIC